MPDGEKPAGRGSRAELNVSPNEARHLANLLRYAISLNTTVGLVRAERRLTSTTQRTAELVALVLEGKALDEADEEAGRLWTGSLEEDHRHALQLLQTQRAALTEALSGRLTPEKAAQYLEVTHDQFLELVRPPHLPPKNANDPRS